MEKIIDCFLIGHNEIDLAKHRKLLVWLYGKNSPQYRDRIIYNLAQLRYKGENFSPIDFFNKIYEENNFNKKENDLSIIDETFNLAIAVLGSYLLNKGMNIDYTNSFNKCERNKLRVKLEKEKILTVAVTTTYYIFSYPIIEIVSFIRKINPDIKIIIGGPFIANQVRSTKKNELNNFFNSIGADIYIYSNYGEQTLYKVINAVKNDENINQIDNIYYKNGDSYVSNSHLEEKISIEKNMINWDFFKNTIKGAINYRTSLSCPFSCNFCNFPGYAGKFQSMQIDSIEQELRIIKDMGCVTHIQFIDDSFNVPRNRFKNILKMMIRNNFDFHWSSFFRSQYVDEEVISLMKKSGCKYVFLGIESGSQEILDNMNKKVKLKNYYKCLELFHKYNIQTVVSVIIGFPGETEKTFNETYKFIEDTKPDFFQQRLWWYDNNAPIYKYREKYKLEGEGYNWKHKTLDSKKAHDFGDYLFLNIKNSIHITEYPLVFFLMKRGLSIKNIKTYISNFHFLNKVNFVKKEITESSSVYIENMKKAVLSEL